MVTKQIFAVKETSKISTVKVTNATKERLSNIDLAAKGKTFDSLINELVSYYERNEIRYKKDAKDWKKQFDKSKKSQEKYENNLIDHEKEKEMWSELLKWARKQGFKG